MGDADEVAALERVLLRLARTEEDRLGAVLEKLLPRLLERLGDSDAVRTKTLQVLQHINKRVKDNLAVKLPCLQLVEMARPEAAANGFVANFALVYLELGAARLLPGEKSRLAPALIQGLSSYQEMQQAIICRVLATILPAVSIGGEMAGWLTPDTTPEDIQVVLSYFLDWLFMAPPQQSAYGGTATAVPEGLTPGRVARLKHKNGSLPTGGEISDTQVAVLRLVLSGAFREELIIPHLVVGRSALRHDVVSAAEQGMARLLKRVDLEDETLLYGLLNLVCANIQAPGSSEPTRKQPPSSVRERALGIVLKTGRLGFERIAQEAVSVMEQVLFAQSSGQLRVLALRFCQELVHACGPRLAELGASDKLALIVRRQVEQLGRLQGSPNSLKEREETYICLGRIARAFPPLFRTSVVLVGDLLNRLEVEPDVRIALQEALSSLCTAFSPPHGKANAVATAKAAVLPFASSEQPKARLVATEWCTRLVDFADAEARFVCVVASCDVELANRQMAIRGLLPELCAASVEPAEVVNTSVADDQGAWVTDALAKLSDAARLESGRLALAWTEGKALAEEHAVLTRPTRADTFPAFDDWIACLGSEHRFDRLMGFAARDRIGQGQLAAILGFSSACLAMHEKADRGMVPKAALETFRDHIEACLELQDQTQSRVLHQVASSCLVRLVDQHRDSFEVQAEWLLRWLASDSSVVRENIAQLVPHCEAAAGPDFVNVLVERINRKVGSAVQARHGAVIAAGTALAGMPGKEMAPEDRARLCSALVAALLEKTKFRIVSVACIQAIGRAVETKTFDVERQDMDQVVTTLEDISKFDGTASGNPELDSSNTTILMLGLETLGKVCCYVDDEELRARATDCLFAAGAQKEPEVSLTVGAALCELASVSHAMLGSVVSRVVNEAARSTRNKVRAASAFWLLCIVREFGASPEMQPHLEQCHATFASLLRERGELTRECAARGMAWTFQSAQSEELRSELTSSLARHLAVKSVFLSEIKREQEREKERKRQKQEDGDLESRRGTGASAGDRADDDAAEGSDGEGNNDGSGPGSQPAFGGALGGAGAAPAPLHAVYKEILEVAVRVKMPPLTYRLLYLSAGDPLWMTQVVRHLRCPAYQLDPDAEGDETTTSRARDDLPPDVIESLIAVLYRYKFDSEKHIQSTMKKLWTTIVRGRGTEAEILAKHLESVMAELLKNVSSTRFRERHGGAMGLTQVIRDSPDPDMVGYLEAMWKLSLRLVDDLNEATKIAAALLAREVSGVTTRLCSVEGKSDEARELAKESLDAVLPFLLEKGLADQSKEGQALAVHTLARVVKVSKKNIRPYIAQATVRLLESMSGLEDQTLQYAMFHTSDQGGDLGVSRDQLESARVQATTDSPMQQAVDVCVDQLPAGDKLEELGPGLARIARSGVGLPTMMATSRTIARLAARRDLEQGVRSHAQALLRGLSGALNDRSPLVRRSFASTAAAVARVADPSAVKDYCKLLSRMYRDPGDDKSRMTVGTALRELLQRAPDLLSSLRKTLLPLLLLARHDDDEDIAEVFQELWSENAGTVQNGIVGHLDLLIPECVAALSDSSWLRKRQGALSLGDIFGAAEPSTLVPHAADAAQALADALPGRLWSGKEAVLKSLIKVWLVGSKLEAQGQRCLPEHMASTEGFVRQTVLPEALRGASNAYASAALDTVATACLSRPVEDPNDLIAELLACVTQLRAATEPAASSETIAKALEALGAAWRANASVARLAEYLSCVEGVLRGADRIVTLGAMQGHKRVLASIVIGPEGSEWPTQVRRAMNVSWRCVVESKHPSALVAALSSMTAMFERDAEAIGGPRELVHELAQSGLARVEGLLTHRDPSVVLAASTLQSALQRHR